MNAARAATMIGQAQNIVAHMSGRTKREQAAIAQLANLLDAAAFALSPEPSAPPPEPVGANAPGTMSATRRAWDRDLPGLPRPESGHGAADGFGGEDFPTFTDGG